MTDSVGSGNAGAAIGRLAYRLVEMEEIRTGDVFVLEGTDPGDHLHGSRALCKATGDAHSLLDNSWGVNVDILDWGAKKPTATAMEASEEKGYPHPGSFIKLPDKGGTIHLQFGHPQEVGRNGCFMHDVLKGIIDNLSVYQQEGHPLACVETERTLDALKIARGNILDRLKNRQGRDVHQTDRP